MDGKRNTMKKPPRRGAQLPKIGLRASTTRFCTFWIAPVLASLMLLTGAFAQTPEKPDLSKQPTVYTVGYAHLDTEWRWEYPQVINEYLRKTMEDNFTLLEKSPHYVFNFIGTK